MTTSPYPLWARAVSNVLSPPVVLSALAAAIAQRESKTPAQAVMLVSFYVSMGVIVPVAYVAWMVHRGKIVDLHMPVREERYGPILVTLLASIAVLVGFLLMDAPGGLIFLAIFNVAANAAIGLITFAWQISVHGTTISGVVMMAAVLLTIHTALLLSPSIFLVGAARLKLKRHTPLQVVAGVGLGALIATVVALLFGA
jgi:membrane-associated phospholipid phosphatase